MWYLRLVIMLLLAALGGTMFAVIAVNLLRVVIEIEDGSLAARLIIVMFTLPCLGLALVAALQDRKDEYAE